MRLIVDQITMQCVVGDITHQRDIDAVANSTGRDFEAEDGVAHAIHAEGGPLLSAACRPLAPIAPGETVITGGFDLPNRWVIHCRGPVYGRDKPEDELLAQCYARALELAEANEISSIAFPAISTGDSGYPMEEAAEVACQAATQAAASLRYVRLLRFVLYRQMAYEAFCPQLVKAAATLPNNLYRSMSH